MAHFFSRPTDVDAKSQGTKKMVIKIVSHRRPKKTITIILSAYTAFTRRKNMADVDGVPKISRLVTKYFKVSQCSTGPADRS
jgi:hypothetical protein